MGVVGVAPPSSERVGTTTNNNKQVNGPMFAEEKLDESTMPNWAVERLHQYREETRAAGSSNPFAVQSAAKQRWGQ
jgi:hypothetical protein